MVGVFLSKWQTLIAAGADSGSSLSFDNPIVLGPLAAFIFTVFVSEVVVSGKAYRREVEENTRLRAVAERVIPLAEEMVTVTTETSETMRRVTDVLDEVILTLAQLGDLPGIRPRRRT